MCSLWDLHYRNLSLRLATKARACKGAGQEGSPGVTSHAPRSRGECEGMNPHIPKWAPTLGMESRWSLESLESNCKGQNPLSWKVFYIIGNLLECRCLNGSYDPFGHFKHKLWPKEEPRVKLPIWLSTIKSQELPQFPWVQVVCNILLEIPWLGLQLFFRPHLNRRSAHKVMGPQSCGSPNCGNFGTFT